MTSFDTHGDWYQQRFTSVSENVIVMNNLAYKLTSQNIFLSSTAPARDYVFINNALANSTDVPSFDSILVSSQIGRSGSNPGSVSHVVVAHNSMPTQGFIFRNDGSPTSQFDSFCLIANNTMRSLSKAVVAALVGGVTIRNNHIQTGFSPLAEAVDTTIGGDADSLFENFRMGNFKPKGDLLNNLKPPVLSLETRNLVPRPHVTAGVIQPSIPE